jgi:hypothetical protein
MTQANTNVSTGLSVLAIRRAADLRHLLGRIPSGVVINLVVPVLIYRFLTNHGATDLAALLVAGVVPAVDVAWGWLRNRHVSAIGLVALGTVAAGVVAGLLSNNPFFVLIRDSFVFAVLALVCGGSLLLPRPLSFVLGRAAAGARGQAAAQAYAARWDDDAFRRRQRAVTCVWGWGSWRSQVSAPCWRSWSRSAGSWSSHRPRRLWSPGVWCCGPGGPARAGSPRCRPIARGAPRG